MVATVAGIHLGIDTHANRPAANTVPDGSIYSCSTHSLVYKSNFAGNSWATWATLGGTGLSDPMTTRGDIIVRNASNVTARLAIGSSGKVLSSDGTDISWQTPAGGGATIQYPALKPGTPTDDFAAASLAGGWSAHSNLGSFTTGHCMTQGEDWLGSSLEMQFSGQSATIYQTHANTDLDFTIGGMRWKGNAGSASRMVGIAALNSSGTGVGVVMYDDNNAYLATITTYEYTANSDNWSGGGAGANSGALYAGDFWLRLKRVSGTWTGYASKSGRAWDKTFATRADSITVAELHVGILYLKAVGYNGRLTADYWQVDV